MAAYLSFLLSSPAVFPNPERLDPTRPKKSYILMGSGLHFCCESMVPLPCLSSFTERNETQLALAWSRLASYPCCAKVSRPRLRHFAIAMLTSCFSVFKLKNLRRAPGQQGKFIKCVCDRFYSFARRINILLFGRVHEDLGHEHDACTINMYLDHNAKESPVPTSLVIEYDA